MAPVLSLAEQRAAALAGARDSREWYAATSWLLQHPDQSHDVLVRHLEERRQGWEQVPPLLARMGRPEAVPALVDALEDESAGLAVGQALGLHPDPAAVQALAQGISAPSAHVALASIEGLRLRRDPGTCAEIIRGLGHLEPSVRQHALQASTELACVGPRRLHDLAADPDPRVRKMARDLLAEDGDQGPLTLVADNG